jgi:hypothetical protein
VRQIIESVQPQIGYQIGRKCEEDGMIVTDGGGARQWRVATTGAGAAIRPWPYAAKPPNSGRLAMTLDNMTIICNMRLTR